MNNINKIVSQGIQRLNDFYSFPEPKKRPIRSHGERADNSRKDCKNPKQGTFYDNHIKLVFSRKSF